MTQPDPAPPTSLTKSAGPTRDRRRSVVRTLSVFAARGAAAACYIVGIWLGLTLIFKGLTLLANWWHFRLDDVPIVAMGWLLAIATLGILVVSTFHPRRLRQQGCMHSDPRHEFRRSEDGSPTITWLQSELVKTDRKVYRRYWCTRCLRVWVKR